MTKTTNDRARGTATADNSTGGRARRIPMGSLQRKMPTPDLEGYFCRWFNNEPGRIQRAIQGGWEHVTIEEMAANGIDTYSVVADSDNVSLVVGRGRTGEPLLGFLMKIKAEWRMEDEEAKEETRKGIDDTLRRGELNDPGTGRRYVKNISVRN